MLDLDLECEWDDLDAAFESLEADLVGVVRGISFEIWRGVLLKTPQFLGRMAASWSYSLNVPNYTDRSSQVDTSVTTDERFQHKVKGGFGGLYRGHPGAIAIANREAEGKASSLKLGDVIWIANGVDHGEGPYSSKVEDGGVALRPWNLPGAPVKRTLGQVLAKYSDDVSSREAQALKLKTLEG